MGPGISPQVRMAAALRPADRAARRKPAGSARCREG